MIIVHNMLADNTQRQLKINTNRKAKLSEQLSSGYCINRAADDAAGLSISEKMRAQIRGLDQGANNIQDGISLLNTADGALNEVHAILQRMNELSVQAANDTYTTEDREAVQTELRQMADEINHISETTTFNTMQIFDDAFKTDVTSVTGLVKSPSANSGYLSEAVEINGKWFPAATLDFSGITADNIERLHLKGFSFNCSQNCSEVFDFKFSVDGTPSSASNLDGRVTHKYVIDISGCTSGAEIVDAIYNFVSQNMPSTVPDTTDNLLPGALPVSHSNYLAKSADGNGLLVYANWAAHTTETAAKTRFPNSTPGSGAIDCSSLTSLVDVPANPFNIQCGPNSHDSIKIEIKRMNATFLGVNTLNVRSHTSAGNAITQIQNAIQDVSSRRTSIGAYVNRLEHIHQYNLNTSENTQAAESRIRDADIADTMVEYSMSSILEQAGMSMLSQANALPQNVLSLLQ